jgi:predicted transport protein
MNKLKEYYSLNEAFNKLAEELRKKIISLNPNIKEVFRRYYISYKLDKCFTYIWFTKEAVWIYLKTDENFKDKLKICEPVHKGVNATFDKRVKLKTNNLDYIFSLIKRSYEIVSR